MAPQPIQDGMADLIGRMLDDVGRLVGHHVALVRVELQQDARAVGTGVARAVACGLVLLVGYALVNLALVVFLGRVWGPGWAALAVGGANLLGGGVGLLGALRRLRRPLLGASLDELEQTTEVLGRPVPALEAFRGH